MVGQIPLELCEEPMIQLVWSHNREVNVDLSARGRTRLPRQEFEAESVVVVDGAWTLHHRPVYALSAV